MKFNYSLVFFYFITNRNFLQISKISLFFLQIGILLLSFFEKKKSLIGFEPMTYALPWRYSTTELKGLHLSQFPNKEPANMNMSLVHLFVTAYTQIIYI